ncbi:MAG: hypothetical protein ACLGSD_10435 [Acidobacteriota bacterium]
MSAVAALGLSAMLAGCGQTYYFAGRVLPPSGLSYRVMVAIQNPGTISQGALEILDAYYDVRFAYNNPNMTYSISGYSGNLPLTIQNFPEEQFGAVYSSGDGGFTGVNYQKEATGGSLATLPGASQSIFVTRDQSFIFAANQNNHTLTVVDKTITSGEYTLNLPGVYRVSVNPGGTVALAFVQNSNYIYYAQRLSSAQTLAYSGGSGTWPKAAVDCEPQNAPQWCLYQAQSPDHVDATGTPYGAPLAFDRPVKAIFSNDGGTAYILNCGPECGGTASSVSVMPVGPMIFEPNQGSGKLPSTGAVTTIPVPGGASNALINSSTMYVVGQQLKPDGLFTGNLTVINLSTNTVAGSMGISDGSPGAPSRMILGDDNTLWVAMTGCTNGERYAKGLPYGCLTMFNTSSNTVTTIEPYEGDATGLAAVTTLHKLYAAQGGQVYIFSTKDGTAYNNQYVTVTGTAYDLAYMDAPSDADNTVY